MTTSLHYKIDMETAVYSGSFNPLHIGHLAILQHLVGEFDKVLLVVSPKNPLKASADASDGPQRLQAAREAVARHPELCDVDSPNGGIVEVSDIEFHLPIPNYTINTLEALHAANSDESITLIMGGDQIADIRRWRSYERILTEFSVAVFPREGFDLEAIKADLLNENPDYRIRVMDMPLVKVSSSQIREAIARGEDSAKLLM